ncbi:MAG TPA: serine O-acetyltransferase EpsC [Myxococcaceae bacterium]|nr:serine O-acetyltransferase EpsC [Myxococcaceae bacterium]
MSDVPEALVKVLCEARRRHAFPSEIRPLAQKFSEQVLGVLFPHYASPVASTSEAVVEEIIELKEALARLQRAIAVLHPNLPRELPDRFIAELAELRSIILEDADAIFYGDPAAKSLDEIILTYPGFYATAIYRIANALHRMGYPLLPRLLTEHAHEKTGVDIHPGARIGRRFMIDHGTGVVIGETTVIGNRVKIYQGVTLGAAVVKKEYSDQKRHPTIEDDVVIYAGATILGGDTVVGHNSVIGGNAWLTQSVPPFSVVSRRAEVRKRQDEGDEGLDFII